MDKLIDSFLELALKEDIHTGDHTTLACVPSDALGKANLVIKQAGILAGVELAEKIYRKIDPSLQILTFLPDGTAVRASNIAFEISGNARAILTGERLVLNFMQRMSGIATLTNQFAEAVKGTQCSILDTRKTTPGLRFFEKWAVRLGGGENHRFGLYDMILIKDNHIDFCGGIRQAIDKTNQYLKNNDLELKIEIEARNLDEVDQIIRIGGVHRIMLDNFSLDNTRKAVELIAGNFETETSGMVNLETVRAYADCGVDYVSVGAITHSAVSLDMSLNAVS